MFFHDIYTGFQHVVLPNGLTLYVQERPEVSWCYAGFVVHAGAREDPTGRQGLAHVVEHLVSENVAGMTFLELRKRVKTLGGLGYFGSVSYLSSQYHFHMPAHEAAMQEVLSLFGQMLLFAQLTRKIAEEKAVILREYHQTYEHEADRAWKLQGRPFLFEEHPFLGSYESALGIPEEFLQATPQELQTFYDTYYVPKNMSLVCIGKLPLHKLVPMLDMSPWAAQKPGQRHPRPEPFCPRPPREHEQVVTLSEFSTLGASKATISFEWVIPLSFPKYSVRFLGFLLSNLLSEELRHTKMFTYEVVVDDDYYQDCRTFQVALEVPPEALSTTQAILWQQLGSIHEAEHRFQETKQEFLNSLYRMDYSGFDLLEATMVDLEEEHRLMPFTEKLQLIEQTTFDQMVELASYLTPERHFCFIMQP